MTEWPTASESAYQRQLARSETLTQIKAAARGLLAESGVAAVQLPAIARTSGRPLVEVNRFVVSLDVLMDELIADLWDELAEAIEDAIAGSTDALWDRLADAARTFRRWSIEHPQEFKLLFDSGGLSGDGPYVMAGLRFGEAFGALYAELWETRGFPAPALDPALEEAMRQYAAQIGLALPPEAVAVFISNWSRLYGSVTTEVLAHVAVQSVDAERLFERELFSIAESLGATAEDLAPRAR